jgi:hypothetical protein
MAQNAQNLGAARTGTYGGARQLLANTERERNLMSNLSNIETQGLQSAYDRAMQTQQYGAGLGMQGLGQAGQLYGLGMQGVQTATGAGQYGLQGAGLAGQAAGTLGQLGQTQFGQETAITDAQMRAGALQRQEEQAGLDAQYQEFLAERNFPLDQLERFSGFLRGYPTQTSTAQYQNPNPLSQVGGAVTTGYGLYQMGKKEGGQIHESGGLADLGMYNAMKKGSK